MYVMYVLYVMYVCMYFYIYIYIYIYIICIMYIYVCVCGVGWLCRIQIQEFVGNGASTWGIFWSVCLTNSTDKSTNFCFECNDDEIYSL
jgi:hypothetical protein